MRRTSTLLTLPLIVASLVLVGPVSASGEGGQDPTPPSQCKVVARTQTGILIDWRPGTNGSEYIVFRNGSELVRVPESQTKFHDGNLPSGTYSYRVATSDGATVSESTYCGFFRFVADPPPPPPASPPTTCRILASSAEEVVVDFNASANSQRYVVHRNGTEIARLSFQTKFRDTAPLPGANTYAVAAIQTYEVSSFTPCGTAIIEPVDPPALPSCVATVGTDAVTVTWSDFDDFEEHIIWRSLDRAAWDWRARTDAAQFSDEPATDVRYRVQGFSDGSKSSKVTCTVQ